ncbi:MAG: rRNA maturation RNase YbeY [Ferruginibacter sp.]
MPISFHFQKKTSLKNRRVLKQFISWICEKEKRELKALDFILCDNEYMLCINRDFLKHDFFTDIITFDMSENASARISGEIYISSDMVADNALEYKSVFSNELHRVIFHGVLHLCGYNDKTPKQKIVMRRKENFYLIAFAKYLSDSKSNLVY